MCGCYLRHQTVNREHVTSLLACFVVLHGIIFFSFCLPSRTYVSPLSAAVCHPPGDNDYENVINPFQLHFCKQ